MVLGSSSTSANNIIRHFVTLPISAVPGLGDSEEKQDGPEGAVGVGGGGGRRGGVSRFPREVSAWQLQRRLQRKVLRLENGLTSRVPFEEIEGEVQVRKTTLRQKKKYL